MSDTGSPLAPQSFPQLPPLAGVALGTLAAGLRYQGRNDLFVAELAEGTSVAGVFTRSLCPSAPVDWCKQLLDSGARTARATVHAVGPPAAPCQERRACRPLGSTDSRLK